MFAILFEKIRQWQERWANWCGDREMERAIRNHLDQEGFYGNFAKLTNVRLVAVGRPGWVQVFRFDVDARQRIEDSVEEGAQEIPAERLWLHRFGILRDDARGSKTEIRIFENEAERKELFAIWSDGLICLRGAQGLQSQSTANHGG